MSNQNYYDADSAQNICRYINRLNGMYVSENKTITFGKHGNPQTHSGLQDCDRKTHECYHLGLHGPHGQIFREGNPGICVTKDFLQQAPVKIMIHGDQYLNEENRKKGKKGFQLHSNYCGDMQNDVYVNSCCDRDPTTNVASPQMIEQGQMGTCPWDKAGLDDPHVKRRYNIK